jgi:hypothetical protein
MRRTQWITPVILGTREKRSGVSWFKASQKKMFTKAHSNQKPGAMPHFYHPQIHSEA